MKPSTVFLFLKQLPKCLAFRSYDMPKGWIPWSSNGLSVDYLPIPGGSLSTWTIHLWFTTLLCRVLNTGLTEWGYYFDIETWHILMAINRVHYLILCFVCLEKTECEFFNFSPILTGYLFISLWAQFLKWFVLS